ncbi:MAG: hypothetical protein SFY69_02925 [Planctomycetota bacterium]|nr:hypothetical protein [Planctomycetota bacterium]
MRRSTVLASVVGLACITPQALSDILDLGLWRSLSARSSLQPPSGPVIQDIESIYLPEYGPFSVMDLSYDSMVEFDMPAGLGESSSFHQSSLVSGLITGRGGGTAYASTSANMRVQSSAGAGLVYGFSLSQATPAVLSGSISLDAAGFDPALSVGTADAYLYRIVNGQAEYALQLSLMNVDDSRQFMLSTILPEGEYRLGISSLVALTADAPADSGDASGSWNVTLALPSPGGVALLLPLALARVRRR